MPMLDTLNTPHCQLLREHKQPLHLHILCTIRSPMTPHPAAQDTDNTAFCTIRRRMHLRKPLWHAHARTCANICDTYRPGPGVHSVSAQPTTSGDIATKWLAVGTSAGATIIELSGLHQPRRRTRQSRADAQRPPGTHAGTLRMPCMQSHCYIRARAAQLHC
jgi:hypothetical protein